MERESCCSLSLGAMTPRKGLANPMADSTRIDGGFTTTSTLTPKLNRLYSLRGNDRVGSEGRGRSISQNQRSNSYSTLSVGSPTKSPFDLNRSTSSSIINRSKLNLSQLDPRTYANVNSTGLASRIAKYHESAGGAGGGVGHLQRSISVNTLPMPLARPRRSIVSSTGYSPSAPKLSATRIAPPERSFYSGNTLSSLLRSNSVVGVVHKSGEQQQGQEQLSRENRPILHPPPTQQEIEPTRSVLEELKEISRKRINSGEPHEPPHEFAKKRMAEFVDPHSHVLQASGPSPHQMPASFKRQREQPLPLTVAVPLRQPHNMPPSPVAMHHHHLQSNGGSGGSSISKLGTPTQLSPEQQAAKRRNCSYSNDISSSLSSSRRQSHKRKLYDMRVNLRQSITGHELSSLGTSCNSSPETSPSQQASKIQRKVEMESVSKTLSMPTPTATVVAVPVTRMHSAPTETDGVRHSTPPIVQATKPKLTLFNAQQKNQSNQEQEQSSSDLNSPEVDASEYAGIQFVKPKQQNSKGIGIGKNPSIERMQKTKLAIMLSGLRGEMYIGEPEDDTDAPLTTSSKLISPIKPIIASTTITATTTTTATTTATTGTKTSETNVTKTNVEFKLQPSSGSSNSTIAQVKPSTMFGNQIKTLTPPAAAATTAATTTTESTASKTAATTTTPFTFGDAIKGAAANMTQPKNDSTSVMSKPQTKNVASVNPILSFGEPKVATASVNLVPSSNTTPAMLQFGAGEGSVTTSPMFSFGNKTAATTTSTITNPTTTATTNTAFTFGSGTSTTTSTAATAAAAAPPAAATTTAASIPTATTFGQLNKANSSSSGFGGFSFGGNAAAPTTTPSLGAFGNQSNSFLNSSKQPEATTAASSTATNTTTTSVFGSQSSTSSNSFANAFKAAAETNPNPASQETAKAFSFGSTAAKPAAAAVVQPKTTASTTNHFSFGTTNDPTTTKPAEQAPSTSNMFGQSVFGQKPAEAATTTSTPFAFGGGANTVAPTAIPTAPATAGASTPFSFGAASKPAAPEAAASTAFTFGGLKHTAAPAATTSTEKSTPFAFGGAKPAASGGNLFSFGGAAAAAQAPTANTMTGGGGGAPSSSNNSAFNFSANSVQKPAASVFGSQTPSSTATAAPFSFGGAAAVEQHQQQQQSNQPSAPSSSGFSFGAAINKTNGDSNGASNIFGAPTGVVKPSFAFGDNKTSTTSTTAAPAPAQSTGFGGFGAVAAAGGASNQQIKPFSFGGNSSASVAPAAASIGGNLFANAVAAAQFGAASNLPSAAPNNSATAKPFNFGGAQPASNNVFSPSTQTTATVPKPSAAAFQFGAPAPASPAAAQQINANNVFAPPPPSGASSGTESRPIRRATRRLQK